MYWKILKVSETTDTVTYAFDMQGKDLRGLVVVNKNTLEYKIIEAPDFKVFEFFYRAKIRPKLYRCQQEGNFPDMYEKACG